MSSPFLPTLNQQLDAVETALLAQDATAVAQACQALQVLLQARSRQRTPEDWSAGGTLADAHTTQLRLQRLRQTLLQQGAAATRALAVLLPEQSGGYGGKAAFSPSSAGPNTKRYLA